MTDAMKDFHLLRYESNKTQDQIAEEAGINAETLSHWERGRVRHPRYDLVEKVAKILGISEKDLYAAIEISWKAAKNKPRRIHKKKVSPDHPKLSPKAA